LGLLCLGRKPLFVKRFEQRDELKAAESRAWIYVTIKVGHCVVVEV
jgi:hypothetical protein